MIGLVLSRSSFEADQKKIKNNSIIGSKIGHQRNKRSINEKSSNLDRRREKKTKGSRIREKVSLDIALRLGKFNIGSFIISVCIIALIGEQVKSDVKKIRLNSS